MIEYKVKKGPGLWLDEKDEIKVAGFIRDIVKEDDLRVLAFNICGDHVHMFLVCAPDELSNIVRKLKGKSAQKYKEYLQIEKEKKFHLWAQKFSKTIIRPSREGNNLHRNKGLGDKGLQPLVAENIHSHFHNTIKYIQRNREKHNLPNNKELQLIIADMLIGSSHINHSHISNDLSNSLSNSLSNDLSNKGLQPLVAEAEAVADMAGTVCDIDSAFAPQYKGGFDVIIGNPPWGADIDDIKYLEDHYPNSTKQHKDIYKIFIEKAAQLLKDGGIFGFIIPNTILLQPRFKDARQFLNQYKLLHIINLGERVFEGVEAPSCVIICEKLSKPKNHKVKVFDLSFSKDNELKANELRKCKYSEIAQSDYDKSPDTAFVMEYKKLERDEVILDEVLDIKDAGINYQRVKVGMQEKGRSDLAKRLLYEGQQENKLDKMYYKGEDIDRYFIKEKTKRFVKINYKNFIKNNEVVRLSESFYNIMPKIIWRQTADRIIATLDNRGVWFGRSIQGGILKKEYENKIDLRYLIVLLNSKYFNYLYTQLTKETGRVFPQVKLSKVKQLPIKIISLEKQKPFMKLADKMLKLNKELQKFDPVMDDKEYKEIMEEIERTDGEIDERVVGIYGLDCG